MPRHFNFRFRRKALGFLLLVPALLLAACASSATQAVGQNPTTVPLQTNIPVAQGSPPVNTPAVAPLPRQTMPPLPPTAELVLMEQRKIGEYDAVTFLIGDGSEATFTVQEQLARLNLPNDAVVRTSAISGEIHLDGRPSVIQIDLHLLSSDQSRRGQYVRQRMFPNDPIASFAVADFGQLPKGFTDGENVTGAVTGLLTLKDTTVPLSFELEARDDGDVLFVLGRTLDRRDELTGGHGKVADHRIFRGNADDLGGGI